MYYVYILQSEVDATYYVGFTENIENRIAQHNNGKSNYTSRKIPWKLVYVEKFEIKSAALKREKFLKKQRNSVFYQKLIKILDR